jgi:hypothetical protein
MIKNKRILFFAVTFLRILLSLIIYSSFAKCDEIEKIKKFSYSGLNFYQFISADVDMRSSAFINYQSIQTIANQQIEYPNMRLTHLAITKHGKREFLKTYTLNEFGFRRAVINVKAKQHFIMAGDSHIFGHGCNDNETITTFLASKFSDFQMINLGISGSGGNSLLYFLNHYNLKAIIPSHLQHGIFVYDFSDYLIERMIGSKNFIKWGWMQPAYRINSKDNLEFENSFNGLWTTKFYKFINFIDPNNYFFPNLPRISQIHLELTARIFLELKKKYLEGSNIKNHFYILINPFFLNKNNNDLVQKQIIEFKKVGIDILYSGQVKLRPEFIYQNDKHLTPKAHKYYAKLISKVLSVQLKGIIPQ